MKILILGCDGQLGSDLKKVFKFSTTISRKQDRINYFNKKKLKEMILKKEPQLLINCVAYTKVAHSKSEKIICNYLNNILPKYLAKICKTYKIILIHFSTDYVFDGKKKGLYYESSKTSPINFYGATKLKGEKNILKQKIKSFIIRISWLYNIRFENNFINKVKFKIKKKINFSLPINEIGAPISTSLASRYIKNFVDKIISKKVTPGIYNLTCRGRASRCAIGKEIARLLKLEDKIVPIEVTQNRLSQKKVKRPLNSILCLDKIENCLSLKILNWKKDLKNNILK